MIDGPAVLTVFFGLPGRCRYSRTQFRCGSPQSGRCVAVRSFGLGGRHCIGQLTLGHLCNRRYRRCICCVPLGGAIRKSSGGSLSDVVWTAPAAKCREDAFPQ